MSLRSAVRCHVSLDMLFSTIAGPLSELGASIGGRQEEPLWCFSSPLSCIPGFLSDMGLLQARMADRWLTPLIGIPSDKRWPLTKPGTAIGGKQRRELLFAGVLSCIPGTLSVPWENVRAMAHSPG